MHWISFIDYSGTFVFAISGMMAAVDKKFDLFGVIILGMVTAIGGGTLRDLLIGSTPVAWMSTDVYVYIILSALPFCYFFSSQIRNLRRSIFLFDTLGIGLFTILGLEKTLEYGLSPLVAVMMGITSAVFGGVIRDVLSNEIPLIFRREVYAFACLFGALVYLGAIQFLPKNISSGLSIACVILVRVLAIRKKWRIPFVD
ncbi:trimeric intracellular cation channel family protein [Marinilongibacter aquaticus]|uniref:trimeric intracellular cation channel family protein n=1 Tax=Marinilongibacter aquaticus TaxID=2975157 RepID=UPI0021BD545B|nr:trimeric intracellular cation channel family protein [Marinilongibacter aquaticus]UBM58630.1 trimeric intracellular cation channel family protein [Marinilongibacter aquaticus]